MEKKIHCISSPETTSDKLIIVSINEITRAPSLLTFPLLVFLSENINRISMFTDTGTIFILNGNADAKVILAS